MRSSTCASRWSRVWWGETINGSGPSEPRSGRPDACSARHLRPECSTLFNSGFMAENSRNITIEDFTTGPCPGLRSMGHIPDVVLRRSNDATKARFSYCPNHRARLSGALNDPVDVLQQNRRLYLAFQTATRQVEGFHA